TETLSAVNFDLADHRPGLHRHDDFHAGARVLRKDAHIFYHAERIQLSNVGFDDFVRIRLSYRCSQLRQDSVLRDGSRSGIFHVNRLNDWRTRWRLLSVDG